MKTRNFNAAPRPLDQPTVPIPIHLFRASQPCPERISLLLSGLAGDPSGAGRVTNMGAERPNATLDGDPFPLADRRLADNAGHDPNAIAKWICDCEGGVNVRTNI